MRSVVVTCGARRASNCIVRKLALKVFSSSFVFLCHPPILDTRKKRDRYEERVRKVERVAFTPLVFSTTGGAGKLTTTFLKRLAACMADQSGEAYSKMMAWLSARLALSLLRRLPGEFATQGVF